MQAPETARKCPGADSASGYKVGPGRPPLHTRFKKGQSGAGAVREAAKAAIEKLGAEKSNRLEPNPPYFAGRLKLPGTTTREVSSRPSHSRG
jgi:hypothetical protein